MYGGSAHEGSLRAVNTENDERRATLEQIGINSLKTLFGSEQMRYMNAFRRFLFAPVIWPRTETSTEKWKVLYVRERSATRGAYFPSLKSWLRSILPSHGHVSSNNTAIRELSSTINNYVSLTVF